VTRIKQQKYFHHLKDRGFNTQFLLYTIIVLKITLLHSVSVITNFVIRKRDKKQTKNITFFVYTRRATHDLHHTWDGNRGGSCHFCTPLLFLIRSVVSPLWTIENLWENVPTVGKWVMTLLIVPEKRPN